MSHDPQYYIKKRKINFNILNNNLKKKNNTITYKDYE